MPSSSRSFKLGPSHTVVRFRGETASEDAFRLFFRSVPPNPNVAFVVVAPPDSPACEVLPEHVAEHTTLPVTTVNEPISASPNHVYLSRGVSLVLEDDVLKPAPEREPTRRGGGPVVHVLRWRDADPQRPESRREEPTNGQVRLAADSPSSDTQGGTVPIVMIDDGEAPTFPAEKKVAPWGKSRTQRLEAELQELRRELRDMVQRYEIVQRRLRRANSALEEKNELLEERTEQVEDLTEALTSAEEKERERLSHVLHDDLQQVLYAVRTKVDLVTGREALDNRGHALLSRALELIDAGIETTRTLAADLFPSNEESLWAALDTLTMQMQEAYGLSVEVHATEGNRTVDENLRRFVYCLVRELLFNVVKHAGTDEAVLSLRGTDDRLLVIVEDEGKGFRPKDVEDEGGFGLPSVRRRVEGIGGRFEVQSALGEGTRVELSLPYEFTGA